MPAVDGLSDAIIRRILQETRRIGVVGASPREDRPSNRVLQFLVGRGYDVIAVNPRIAGGTLHGRPVVACLDEATPLDMVDIFRNSGNAGAVVDEAIRLKATTVWMQLGVIDHEAAGRAREQGIVVVMDRCPVIEVRRLEL